MKNTVYVLCVFSFARYAKSYFIIFHYSFSILEKGGRTDDVMKTPSKKDLRTPRLCNPSAFQLS